MLPPGPATPEPLQILRWLRAPLGFFEECRERYGPTFTLRLGIGAPVVCLTDPDDVRTLFTAPADVLHPGEGGRILEPILGPSSLLLLDGDAHLEERRLLLPAFHGERMAALQDALVEITADAVASWPRGVPVALHPRLQRLTLEVILRAVFGLHAGPRRTRFTAAMDAYLTEGSRPVNLLPVLQRDIGPSPWGRFLRVRRAARALVREEVDRRRGETDEADDVLGMLLRATRPDGSPMPDDAIEDELMTLLVAGHETTASQLAWTFERLARLPALAARVRAAALDGDDALLTATVQEALRQRPVLPIAQPRSVRAPFSVAGYDLAPRSCALTANIHLVHHDPVLYPDPHAFRPERFLERAPGTYTWIPFGGGRRRCLGMGFAMLEMRIVLAEVMRRGTVTAVGPADGEARRRRHITLSPRHGARVVLG